MGIITLTEQSCPHEVNLIQEESGGEECGRQVGDERRLVSHRILFHTKAVGNVASIFHGSVAFVSSYRVKEIRASEVSRHGHNDSLLTSRISKHPTEITHAHVPHSQYQLALFIRLCVEWCLVPCEN